MGITNESEESNYTEDESKFLTSFSAPYSPPFYLNNKIYDKSKTIQSVIEESLKENIDFNINNNNINQVPNGGNDNNIKELNKEPKKLEKSEIDLYNKKISFNSKSTNENNSGIVLYCTEEKNEQKNIFPENIDLNENDEDNITNKPLIYKSSSLQKDIRFFYKFKDFLGEGHFGSVRTAFKKREYSSHKLFAVKSISLKKLTENEHNDLIREVEIISHLEHPHIIKFYETFHDKFYFHIVTELCRGNDLNMRLKKIGGKMKEEHTRIIIMKILHAINYCHSFGVVHRDLKPENIVFESPNNEEEDEEENETNNNFNIKIIDFGLSILKNKTQKLHTILGTPYYMAPEVLKGDYNEKCDIWSIGAITYYLLTGSEPFKGETTNKIFAKILYTEPDYNPEKFRNISQNAIDFIKKCFVKDPDKRLSCLEGLKHPWFEPIFKKIHAPKFIDDNLLYNISNTKKYSHLKKIIMKYMVYNMGHTELSVYKKAFLAFDKYNSGVITPDELKNLFNIYHKPLTEEQIKNIMSVSDDNNNFLTYNEFIICCLRIRDFISPKKLFDAFLYFDIDNNNIIDMNDIYLALLRWGKDVTDKSDVENIIYFGTKKKYKELNLKAFIEIFSDEINKDEYLDKINKMKEEMKEIKDNKDNNKNNI